MGKKRKIDGSLQSLSLNPGSHAGDSIRPQSHVAVSKSGECYIVDLAHHSAHNLIGAAATSDGLAILSLSESELTTIEQSQVHTKDISSVKFDPECPTTLLASGLDGTVRGWDTVAGAPCSELRNPKNAELYCFDKAGHLLAAGADGTIIFWDVRQPDKVLQEFADTHEKHVTQVLFHPSKEKETFLSASEDGLISAFSTTNGLDEDEGFVGALNLMDSVARMGVYGKELDKLWCSTSTECIHLWDWQAACSEEAAGGEGPSSSCQDLREQLNPSTEGDTEAHELSTVLSVGENKKGKLQVAAAAQDGSFAIVPIRPRSQGCRVKTAHLQHFYGGHSSVVRSMLWPAAHPVIITGGEDGRVVVWPNTNPESRTNLKRKT